MSRVDNMFKRVVYTTPPNSINREGFEAYSQKIEEAYLQMLLTNTLGNTFYADKEQLLEESEKLHVGVLLNDLYHTFGAKALVYARNYGYMRTQPIFGLAILSEYPNSNLFSRIFNRIILTPNDLMDFMQIVKSRRGNEGGRRIKRAIANWFGEKLTPYFAVKYGAERAGGYSLKDLIKISHPNFGAKNPTVAYLLGKNVDEYVLAKEIVAFEALKRAPSDIGKANAIREGKLPHEVATSFAGKSPIVWRAIAENMPIMALLKNLATIERHGIMPALEDLIIAKFTNKEYLSISKILPYRFYRALGQVSSFRVQEALRQATELTFENLTDIPGKSYICIDTSGSMTGYIDTASIFGIALAKKTDRCSVSTFNDSWRPFAYSKYDSIITQAKRIQQLVGGGTNTGVVTWRLVADRVFADNIILITDEQQNGFVRGETFYKHLVTYRAAVNPNVKTFIVNLAPYVGGGLCPPDDPQVYSIYGWSDKIAEFISLSVGGYGGLVEKIKGLLL